LEKVNSFNYLELTAAIKITIHTKIVAIAAMFIFVEYFIFLDFE